MNNITEHSQVHATFVVERGYPQTPDEVWRALSDNAARDQWFGAGDAFDIREKSHDFKVGGHGTEEGQWRNGPQSQFRSTYTDIVDLQRIVFTYDMWVEGQHLSTSLTTITLEPESDGTRLTYTEQGVHFDGLDSVEGREEGSAGLLDQLGAYLASVSSSTAR
jgi:uncharacterized protein YndB with AHSA1/START domain